MSRPVLYTIEQKTPDDPQYAFHCPGCGYSHWFKATGGSPRWEFNGDLVKPTISPSLLVRTPNPATVCHSFVRDGRIQFLNDCTHALAGQTVDLEPDEI